jgi:hypothetical protein
MSWFLFHSQSERFAIEASRKLREQKYDEAKALYDKAAEAEQRALQHLEKSKVRTRGITAASAVALWFKATQYRRAEQLAHESLADPDIPDFARESLRNLVQTIRMESARQKAGATFVLVENYSDGG